MLLGQAGTNLPLAPMPSVLAIWDPTVSGAGVLT